MSFNVVNWVLENSDATKGKRLVLLVLAEVAGIDGGDAFVSVKTMADRARLSERQVQYALRELEAEEKIVSQGSHPKYQTTVYQVVGPFNDENEVPEGGAKTAPRGASSAPGGVQVGTEGGAISARGGASSDTGGVQSIAPEPSIKQPSVEPSLEPNTSCARHLQQIIEIVGEICEIRGLPFFDVRKVAAAVEEHPGTPDHLASARELRYWLCEGSGRSRRITDIVGDLRFKFQRDAERAQRGGKAGGDTDLETEMRRIEEWGRQAGQAGASA